MDRSMNALELLATSAIFEPFVPSASSDPVRALKLLAGLGAVTRASLPAPATAERAAAPSPAAPAPSSQTVRYETRSPEYRGALADASVVEALLSLRPAQQPSASGTAAAPRHVPASEGFKAVRGHFRRTPGIFSPILRPTGAPSSPEDQ